MFVIITDGEENASREYSIEQIKEQIKRQKEKYGWEFVFLGANIDAVATAGRFGIGADRAADYLADADGTSLNFRVMNNAVSEFRTTSKISKKHFEQIREDVKMRGGSRKKRGIRSCGGRENMV